MADVTKTLNKLMETLMHQSMQHFMLYLKGRGLSMSQMGTLLFLHHHGSRAVSDISEHLDITAAASSQLLNRLVDEGLIARQENPQDRRVKQIALTGEGEQVVQESFEARKQWLGELAAALSDEEAQIVNDALQVLIDKAIGLREGGQPMAAELKKEKI